MTCSGSGSGEVSANESLTLDEILTILSDSTRRDLLEHVMEGSGQTYNTEDCVRYLLQREETRSGELRSHNEVKARLHHVHIPKLAETGVFEYDPRSEVIRYWGHDRLENWFKHIREKEDV